MSCQPESLPRTRLLYLLPPCDRCYRSDGNPILFTNARQNEPHAGDGEGDRSVGITYKPPCGEIAMCLRVGRMGPIK
jgi:hypothetical protein